VLNSSEDSQIVSTRHMKGQCNHRNSSLAECSSGSSPSNWRSGQLAWPASSTLDTVGHTGTSDRRGYIWFAVVANPVAVHPATCAMCRLSLCCIKPLELVQLGLEADRGTSIVHRMNAVMNASDRLATTANRQQSRYHSLINVRRLCSAGSQLWPCWVDDSHSATETHLGWTGEHTDAHHARKQWFTHVLLWYRLFPTQCLTCPYLLLTAAHVLIALSYGPAVLVNILYIDIYTIPDSTDTRELSKLFGYFHPGSVCFWTWVQNSGISKPEYTFSIYQ
jgi:hypothetical protein